MSCQMRTGILISFLMVVSSLRLVGQEDSRWRIGPEKINIQMTEDRPPTGVGTVVVSASWGGEMRSRNKAIDRKVFRVAASEFNIQL